MTEHNRLHETLSACMDGEAQELELRQLLRDVGTDEELRQRWQRYNLARSAMTRELPGFRIDVADSVRAAIGDEQPSKSSNVGRVFQSAGRLAVAASVAALAVLGVRHYQFAMDPLAPDGAMAPAVALQTESSPLQPSINFDIPIAARTVGAGGVPLSSSLYSAGSISAPRPILADQATAQEIQAYFDELMSLHAEHAGHSVNPGMLNLMRMPQQAPRPPAR